MRALAMACFLLGCQSGGSGALSGRVVIDGDSDASGVLVRAVGKKSASTLTDASGNYRFSALPDGDYTLVLSAQATLEDQQVVQATITRGESNAPEVHFTAAGSVRGLVTLAGQPGPGAAVFVEGGSAVAISDAAGHYTLDKIAAGAVGLEAVLSGYRPGTLDGLTVARGQVTSAPLLDLSRDESAPYAVAALSGVARRIDRSDSSGTTVSATLGSTTLTTSTASDGSYRFDGISPGIYRIDFSYDGKSEFIPQVLALAGSTGQVIDGALYPLESNPLDLPVARRLVQGKWSTLLVDDSRALIQLDGALQRLALDSGAVTPLTDDLQTPSPLWLSPDRASVLYLGGNNDSYYQGALRTIAVAGGTAQTLASPVVAPEFTADGSRIVYMDSWWNNLFSVPAVGGDPVTLGAVVQHHALTPDGKRVVYQSCDGACQVSVRTVDGGDPLQLLTTTGSIYLSPDGAELAAFDHFDNYLQKGQLYVAAVDGSGSKQLWDGPISDWVQFSADGRWMLFVTNKTELRLFDRQSGNTALVAQNLFHAFPFAPDGRFYYVRDVQTTTQLGTLAQQPAGGGAEMVLGTRVDYHVQLSPDGKQLLFRDQIDASLGTGRVRVADASGAVIGLADGAVGSQFSGDGKYVHYGVSTMPTGTTLFAIPTSGGAAVKLSDGATAPSNESPGGGWVGYFVANSVAQISPSAGGTPQAIGFGDLQWASDSRILLTYSYAVAPYRHQNGLYVYEVTP